jgi:protein-disulfide isomerase
MAKIEHLKAIRNVNRLAIAGLVVLPVIAYNIGFGNAAKEFKKVEFKPQQQVSIEKSPTAKLAMPEVLETLKKMVPGMVFTEDHIIDHERLGVYQFMIKDAIFYMSHDGAALIKGDLFDIAMMYHDPDRSNITMQFERALSFKLNESESVNLDSFIESAPLNESGVKDILKRIPETQLVTFKSENGPAIDTFYVFFDISCPRCKKMMPEINDLQKMGYDVKLILISRTGSSSLIHKHSSQMLCQANPDSELTHYIKRGFSGFSKECSTNLDLNYQVTSKLRVRGTPTTIRASAANLFEGLHYAKEITAK